MVMQDNKVRDAFRSCLATATERLGITGIDIIQQNQPIPTTDHSALLFSVISSRRNGWQGTAWDKNTDSVRSMNEKWDYVEEITMQVSAFHPRKVTDTAETMTSVDIVSMVATFFSSMSGNALLRENGFMPLKITDVRIPVAQDDSQTPQFNPNFDIVVNVHQSASVTIPTITDVGFRGAEFSDGKQVGGITVHRGGLYGV